MSYLNCEALSKRVVVHKPMYDRITGNRTASMLLSQMIFWWEANGKKEFYKYKQQPAREIDETEEEFLERVKPYRLRDSWCEELHISSDIFDSALKRIAHCIYRKTGETEQTKNRRLYLYQKLIDEYDKTENETEEEWHKRIDIKITQYIKCCVIYRTDKNKNITYYNIINEDFMHKLLHDQVWSDYAIRKEEEKFIRYKKIKSNKKTESEPGKINIKRIRENNQNNTPGVEKYKSRNTKKLEWKNSIPDTYLEWKNPSSLYTEMNYYIDEHIYYTNIYYSFFDRPENFSQNSPKKYHPTLKDININRSNNLKENYLTKDLDVSMDSEVSPPHHLETSLQHPSDAMKRSIDLMNKIGFQPNIKNNHPTSKIDPVSLRSQNQPISKKIVPTSCQGQALPLEVSPPTQGTSGITRPIRKLSSRLNPRPALTICTNKPNDKIDDLIDYWNSLDNTTKHKNKSTKIYQQIRMKLKRLLIGSFAKMYPLCDDFLDDNEIYMSFLERPLTEDEIKKGMFYLSQICTDGYSVHDHRCKPKNKSLDNLLFNSYRNSSLFFLVLSYPPQLNRDCKLDLSRLPFKSYYMDHFNKLLNYDDRGSEKQQQKLAYGINELVQFHKRNQDEFSNYRLCDLSSFLELYRNFLSLNFSFVKPAIVGRNTWVWDKFCDFAYDQCHEDIDDLE